MDKLSLFNQQVLICQDEAYTLAWYLLGDGIEAEKATQAAVAAAFQYFSPQKGNCRALILRQVFRLCQRKAPPQETLPIPEISVTFNDCERQTLVLVEILNLSYSEAASVLDCPPQEISRLIAQARRKLIQAGSEHP